MSFEAFQIKKTIGTVALWTECPLLKRLIVVLTCINPLTSTLSPNPGGEGRVRGNDPSILFRDD
jgi:hypothetical protein